MTDEMTTMESELTTEPFGYIKSARINFAARRGQVEQKQLFQQTRVKFLNQLVLNLRARFPNVALLTAMKIFEPAWLDVVMNVYKLSFSTMVNKQSTTKM